MKHRTSALDRWSILWLLVCAVLLSCLWGGLALYSTLDGNSEVRGFLGRQVIWFAVGAGCAVAVWRVDFAIYQRGWPWLLAAAFLFLAALPVAGVTVNAMRGWYDCGWFYLQPSELIKPFFLLAVVQLASSGRTEWQRLWRPLALCALFGFLIARQPDFGTLSIYVLTTLLVCFLSGCSWRSFGILLAGGAAALAVLILRHPYMGRRLVAFALPESDPAGAGWHGRQTMLAIARGGWSGTGLGNAWWSNSYLPLANNDSVFAAVAETLGLFGAWAVLALWGVVFLLIWRLGRLTAEPRRQMFLYAAGGMLGIQTLLHLGVNTGLLPVTGLPLPFYSYGGSSLVATLVLFGLLLSAARPEKR